MNYIAPTYGNRGLNIVKGDSVYLYDDTGKKYIDCFSNMGVNILGYNNKEINAAVYKQMELLTNLHGSFDNPIRTEFAKKLVEISPENLTKVFFCNSGAEAVEAAIKFSRLTGKKEIIAAKMGYHGKTMGALSLTRTLRKYNEPYEPLLEDVKHFSFNNIDSLREIISENTAAVVLEPVQGEGGVKIPDKDFFKQVRELCDEFNALLVIDECQSGMGRTGKFFAIEHFDTNADIICMAKGIAGGLPCAATLVTEDLANKMFKGCHTNTFGGNPLVCAAGIATLDYIKENNLLNNAEEVGSYFIEQLKNIKSPLIREVRGLGLMIAIELKTKMTKYVKALQEKDVLVIPTGANVIRLLPPLIITKNVVDDVVKTIGLTLNS